MTVQRVGPHGVEVVTLALSPDAVVMLDRVARDAYRTSRFAGQARTAFVEAVTAVNSAAAEIMCARRATSGAVSGDDDVAAVASLRPSVVPATDEPASWLTTEEAAQRLGRTEGHTRWLARQGRLTARRAPGGGWRFDPADVATWGARPA